MPRWGRSLLVLLLSLAAPAMAEPLTFTARDVTAVGPASFRATNGETYRVPAVRVPRVTNGACRLERIRGREARKVLRKVLARGKKITVEPTGQRNQLGYAYARVIIDGKSLRRTLLERGTVVPINSRRANPWCIRVTPG